MRTIDEHIQKDQEEFFKALADHNDGKVRHLTEELQWLLDHKQFPNDYTIPPHSSCFANKLTNQSVWSMTINLFDRLGRLAMAAIFVNIPGRSPTFLRQPEPLLLRVFLSDGTYFLLVQSGCSPWDSCC